MDLLTNEGVLSILLFLDRDNLETLQQTNQRLTSIVTDCMNDVCLRYFEYADLSRACNEEGLRASIKRDRDNVHVIKPKKSGPCIVETFTKYLRRSNVGRLSFNECTITPELCEAVSHVSSTVLVNNLGFSFIKLNVEFETFHALIHGFRHVKGCYISTRYAGCFSDTALVRLGAKGATKFHLVAYKDRHSGANRPQCGITDDGLLEFCFGNRQGSVSEKRSVQLESMVVSNDFFAKVINASKHTTHFCDVDIDIETASRTLHEFPPELEIPPVVEADRPHRSVYNYAFVDGKPRTVTVELTFNDINDRSTTGPCYRFSKRPPGRIHQDVLLITFT